MTRLCTFFLSFLISITAGAQKIYFSDTTNSWGFLCVYDATPPIEIEDLYLSTNSYSGDTTLNGKTYSILSGYYVRDDTSTQRVQVYLNDSTEKTLYDYSLNMGDTLIGATNNMKYYYIVNSVNSFTINSISYVRQLFDVVDTLGNNHQPFQVLEGIGCTSVNVFYPLEPVDAEIGCWLCGFSNNGVAPSTNPQNVLPNDCTLSIKNVATTKPDISVYPNPVTGESMFKCNYLIKTGSLIIYNNIGQKIYSHQVNGEKNIPIPFDRLIDGQYFYNLTDIGNNVSLSGSFLR